MEIKASQKITLKQMMENKDNVCRVSYVTGDGQHYLLKAGTVEEVFKTGYVEIIPNLDVMYHFKEVRENKRDKPQYQTNCQMVDGKTGIPLTSVLSVKQLNVTSEEYSAFLDMLDGYEYALNNNGQARPSLILPDKKIIS